jgi:hypothetical protein
MVTSFRESSPQKTNTLEAAKANDTVWRAHLIRIVYTAAARHPRTEIPIELERDLTPMTDIDKINLRGQLQAANSALMAAKGLASAPVVTPAGPIIVQAPLLICGVLEQLSRILDQTIDKI